MNCFRTFYISDTAIKRIYSLLALMLLVLCSKAQNQPNSQIERPDSIPVKVHLNGGDERMGYLVEQNQVQLVLWTDLLGRVSIPKYEVESIEVINEEIYFNPSDRTPHYSGRYHVLFNGLPQEKGARTLSFTLASADYQSSLTERLTVGAIGFFPFTAIGNVNYSIPLLKNVYGSIGGYAGLSTIGGAVAIPYTSITYGTHKANFTFGGGFAHLSNESWNGESTPHAFFAASIPLGKHVQWVNEGMWLMKQNQSETYLIDGVSETEYLSSYGMGYWISAVRVPLKKNNCLQFGLLVAFDTWTDPWTEGVEQVEVLGALPLISYSKSW